MKRYQSKLFQTIHQTKTSLISTSFQWFNIATLIPIAGWLSSVPSQYRPIFPIAQGLMSKNSGASHIKHYTQLQARLQGETYFLSFSFLTGKRVQYSNSLFHYFAKAKSAHTSKRKTLTLKGIKTNSLDHFLFLGNSKYLKTHKKTHK